MLIIGLTGSIAMGKSAASSYLVECGLPVFSADDVVHELYEDEAVGPIGEAFPGVVAAGCVDRAALSKHLLAAPGGFERLEAIVHPLVKARRDRFVAEHLVRGTPMIVLDIPLLFEKQMQDVVDVVLLVTADAATQHRRVMKRPGMTEEKFALILARQVPDAEKRRLADFVVDTGGPFENTHRQLDRFLESVQNWPQQAAARLTADGV